MLSLPYIEPWYWPRQTLNPRKVAFNPRPFTKGGQVYSLGGISRPQQLDLGYWAASLMDIPVTHLVANEADKKRRSWNAGRSFLNGTPGFVVVPAFQANIAPFPLVGGRRYPNPPNSTFDHSETFSDGGVFEQAGIDIYIQADVEIGAVTVRIVIIEGEFNPTGWRFSYNHALYETTKLITDHGSHQYTVGIFPAIRAPIPASSRLEAARPTCLMHLATNTEMDIEWEVPRLRGTGFSVNFVEAHEYWSDLASGLLS